MVLSVLTIGELITGELITGELITEGLQPEFYDIHHFIKTITSNHFCCYGEVISPAPRATSTNFVHTNAELLIKL